MSILYNNLSLFREHGCLGSGQILNVHNYNSNSSLRDAVKECAPRGVDIVFDTVGGDKLGEESLRCLRFGGRYCVVGWTSTPFAAGGKGLGKLLLNLTTDRLQCILLGKCQVVVHTLIQQNMHDSSK